MPRAALATMAMPYTASSEDRDLASQVSDRYRKVMGQYGHEAIDRLTIEMDLLATHLNGTPLDFERMLTVDSFDLVHDIHGINRHLNRKTGKLKDFFSPRLQKRAP